MKRVARNTFSGEHVQLVGVTSHAVDKVKLPSGSGPQALTQPSLVRGSELVLDPLMSASLNLLRSARLDGSASTAELRDHIVGELAGNEADGAQAHLGLDMPANNFPIWPRPDREQVHSPAPCFTPRIVKKPSRLSHSSTRLSASSAMACAKLTCWNG